MDKKLLQDAQLKVADARNSIQALLDNHADEEGEAITLPLLEEILETLDAVDSSIEKLATEQE